MDHHKEAGLNRLYIIDFDLAKQFALGPGVQRVITLPETQLPPPNGLTHFDPYSWDVHCAGRALEWLVEVCCGLSASPFPDVLQSILHRLNTARKIVHRTG